MDRAPAAFGTDFLRWLRAATERSWQGIDDWSPADFEAAGLIGARWRRGTRWTGGLDDATIARVQRRYGVRFPPQYRLFLQTLHSTTPWKRGATYSRHGDRLAEYDTPGFYDWLHDEAQLRAAMRAVTDSSPGELFAGPDHPARWQRGGPSPDLIPIFGHRYVVCDDSQRVVSIVGDDAIVYGRDLRDYLLAELGDVLA